MPTRVITPPGPLQVERMPNGKRKLLRDLKVDVSEEQNGTQIERIRAANVAGQPFVTDYSSLPFGARWTMKWSRVDIAGVVHDKIYRDPNYSRWEAERVWYRIARSGSHSANSIQAAAGYIGLVLGGWVVKPTGKGCTFLHKVIMGAIDALLLLLLAWLLLLNA